VSGAVVVVVVVVVVAPLDYVYEKQVAAMSSKPKQ